MKITSTKLIARVTTGDDLPEDAFKHIAFIGRSNVGKSSVINLLAQKKDLAKSSATPGFTKSINFYLINNKFYFVDLPGYGYAQGSFQEKRRLQELIEWYLTYPDIDDRQLIVLIIDAKVGATDYDLQALELLHKLNKNVIVLANKIDKLKKNDVKKQLQKVSEAAFQFKVIPFSAKDKVGVPELTRVIFEL